MTVPIVLAMALAAAAPEPVVWTPMADPDPNYVAPRAAPAPKRAPPKAARRGAEPADLDSAVVNLMQAARDHDEAVVRDYERQLREAEATIERARQMAEQSEVQDGSAPQR